MKLAIFIYFFMISSNIAFTQKPCRIDSLKIEYYFPAKRMIDSSGLDFGFIYKNITRRDIEIYSYLSEGDLDDINSNYFFKLQKLENGTFNDVRVRYYQNILPDYSIDSIRHFDVQKKYLSPGKSDTLQFNLLDVARGFEGGKYRFKVYLRVGTIRNNEKFDDPLFEKGPPPSDRIIYCISKWFEFTVVGIQMKPYRPLK